jgi:hypothetical protein
MWDLYLTSGKKLFLIAVTVIDDHTGWSSGNILSSYSGAALS